MPNFNILETGKKHGAELDECLEHLEYYYDSIEQGQNPLQVEGSFVRGEGKGLVALSNSSGKHQLATRLYVYAHVVGKTLHVISVGDKSSQKQDIKDGHKYIADLLKADAAEEKAKAVKEKKEKKGKR